MSRTIDFQVENARFNYLETLFHLDGRDSPDHPHYATYTGLMQQRITQLVEQDMRALTAVPQPTPVPVAA